MVSSLVSIIIVNWNGKENLKECLASLAKISYSPYEIIVVDNGSTDGSVEEIEKRYEDIKILRNKENLGFAEGNNVGYQKSEGKYILFLNNDTIVTPRFLDELVNFLEKNPQVGAVQSKIVFHRPGTVLHGKINSVGSFLIGSGFLFHQGYGKDPDNPKYNHSREIFSVNGACFLVRRKVLEKIGVFDTDYFAYFEESDLSQRIWLAGYKIYYDPNGLIYHKGAQSAQKLPVSFIQYHSFKNRLCTYLKNFSLKNLLKIFLPHLLFCEAASIAYLITGKPSYTFAIQKAIFWNIFNLKKTLQKRRKIQEEIRQTLDDKFILRLSKKVRLSYYRFLSAGRLEDYEE